MSDRLEKLKSMLEKSPADAFLLYGIAMEHKKAGQLADALTYFDRVLSVDPGYCYAYYQKAQTLEQEGDIDRAGQVYREGIAAAEKKGDAHAREELAAALDLLG